MLFCLSVYPSVSLVDCIEAVKYAIKFSCPVVFAFTTVFREILSVTLMRREFQVGWTSERYRRYYGEGYYEKADKKWHDFSDDCVVLHFGADFSHWKPLRSQICHLSKFVHKLSLRSTTNIIILNAFRKLESNYSGIHSICEILFILLLTGFQGHCCWRKFRSDS